MSGAICCDKPDQQNQTGQKRKNSKNRHIQCESVKLAWHVDSARNEQVKPPEIEFREQGSFRVDTGSRHWGFLSGKEVGNVDDFESMRDQSYGRNEEDCEIG